METHTYPHIPPAVATVHLALFSDVSNAKELKARLVAASNMPGLDGEREREAMNYCFVNAKLVTSKLHIWTAVYQAILAHVQGALRTKTIHSEILWTLNPSHNISEAIKRFGVSETSTSLFVVRVCSQSFTRQDFETAVGLAVKGIMMPLSSLGQITDWDLVRKYYKINNADPAMQALSRRETGLDEDELSARQKLLIDQIVISSTAMKSVSA